MLLYVTLGTNNAKRAQAFYDPTLATIGMVRHQTNDDEVGYGVGPRPSDSRECILWVTKPFLKAPASWGNGTMIALQATTRAEVDAFHAAAIANGGTDEGAPGLRPYHDKFYACYVRDPDGNKLSAVCEG